MKIREFFAKLLNTYVWGNLLAMVIVAALLVVGVMYGLDLYTHHGESIDVPNVKGMGFDRAYTMLRDKGLLISVSDTGYNKMLPADCVLEQSPGEGTKVKVNHVVYVTVNSPSTPTLALPDIIDNSSKREAQVKLSAMGFKLNEPKLVHGEKDWVYGVIAGSRNVYSGDRIAIDKRLTLVIGDGLYDAAALDQDIDYDDDTIYIDEGSYDGEAEEDDFEEVTQPPAGGTEPQAEEEEEEEEEQTGR